MNTRTKEKNEANRQYEEHLNNYHASFENSPICLFNIISIKQNAENFKKCNKNAQNAQNAQKCQMKYQQ